MAPSACHCSIAGAYYFEKVSYNEPQPFTLVLSPDQLIGLGIPSEVGDALIAQRIDLIGINTTPTQAYSRRQRSRLLMRRSARVLHP